MELLKEERWNFRYSLLYAKEQKEIYILYYRSPNYFLSKNEITVIEDTYIDKLLSDYHFDQNETVTCEDNEYFINKFNTDIVTFCNAHAGCEAVHLINLQYTHKVIFETKVFKALNKCAYDLYLDLGDSAIRIGSDNFEKIRKFDLETGTIIPESAANITVETCRMTTVDFNVYDTMENDSHAINIRVVDTAFIDIMKQYSAVLVSFIGASENGENFLDTRITIAQVIIYGQEVVDVDKYKERLFFSGVNSICISGLIVEKEVQYGSIVKVDNITTASISNIEREIKKVGIGAFITIGKVAKVNLHDIEYKITKYSAFEPDTTIFYFLPDSSSLTRKINIFDSEFYNPTSLNFNLCKLADVEVNGIFISNCDIIGNNITILNTVGDAKIIKLTYNNVNYRQITQKISIPRVTKLVMMDCSFSSNDDITLDASNISINGGLFEVHDFTVDSSKMIFKVSIEGAEIHADTVNIYNNSESGADGTFFDRDTIYECRILNIVNYKPTMTGTKFHIGTLNVTSQDTINIVNTLAFFEKTNVKFNVFSALNGSITLVGERGTKSNFQLNLQDKIKENITNSFDFRGSEETPMASIITNVPIHSKFTDYDNEYVSLSFHSGYDAIQKSILTLAKTLDEIDYKIMTNSEKLCKIDKHIDDESGDTIYEFTKI